MIRRSCNQNNNNNDKNENNSDVDDVFNDDRYNDNGENRCNNNNNSSYNVNIKGFPKAKPSICMSGVSTAMIEYHSYLALLLLIGALCKQL